MRRNEEPSRQTLQEEIDRLKLKWQRKVPDVESKPAPSRLVIVFRRLPYAIRYSTKLDDPDCIMESFDSAQSIEGPGECVTGLWKIIRPSQADDYAKIFGNELPGTQIVVAGEPRVDVSKITASAEGQERLRKRLTAFLKDEGIVPIFLTEKARKERYSQELLFPLFHYRTPPIGTGFSHLDWPAYVEANQAFASALAELYCLHDRFLIFCYQLMLLPQLLRQNPKTDEAFIFFYLSTVFPSSEMFRILPQCQELATGILHANVIAFQAQQYRKHFMTVITRILGVECGHYNVEPCLESGGSGVRVCVAPQGVAVPSWIEIAKKVDTSSLKEKFRGKKIILGVDSLDYTKGIPMKMVAFRKFLSENPDWAGQVVLLQLCVLGKNQPDGGSSSYHRLSQADRKDILAQVFQVTGDINASFGTIDHLPVHFLVGDFAANELAAIYAVADIGFLTALRESFTPSVHHFVLCQEVTNKGVIILSEFSASCQQLSAAVLPVNPWDVQGMTDALKAALTMPPEEREERHELAYDIITRMDNQEWARQILHEIKEAVDEDLETKLDIPPPLPLQTCVEELSKYRHVIIISGIRESLLRTPPALLDQEAMYPQALPQDYTNDAESDDEQEYPTNVTPAHITVTLDAASPPTLVASPFPAPSPTPLLLAMPRSTEGDINLLASEKCRASVIIVSSSSTAVVRKVVDECPNVWAFSENGHYFRRPGTRTFVPFDPIPDRTAAPSSARSEKQVVSIPDSLQKVQDLVEYFARRTPGSFIRRTEMSISWHYAKADKRFASNQARDLCFHLYAGPLLSNKHLELCIGRSSVEVRASAVTKAMVVEWAIKEVCATKNVAPHELGVLCIGNYLPRDEEVYQAVSKIVTGGIKTPGNSHRSTSDREIRHVPGCFTCTIGVRLSKASYRVDTNERIRMLLKSLAEALRVCELPRLPDELHFPQNFGIAKQSSVLSPSLDVAFMLSGHNAGEYYRYLPAGRGNDTNRSMALHQPSDFEEDDCDDEELLMLTAGDKLNLPNGIPFTHARPLQRAEGWAQTVPNLPAPPATPVRPSTPLEAYVTPDSGCSRIK